jgi:peptidoglycan/LPS O-acetylase OafA/YrhL
VLYDRGTFADDTSTFAVCIPYFLPGIMAWVLFAQVRPRLPAFLMPCLVAALLFGFMIQPTWRHGWLLALALGVTLPLFHQIRARWLIRGSHSLAQYSYGIYLIHPFSIALGVNLLHGFSLAIRISAIVCSLAALVFVLHHTVEKPMMKLGARLARKIEHRQELAHATN